MSRKLTGAFVAVFILLFILPSIVYCLFGKYLDETNYEQRTTAEKPTFSWKNINAYPKAFEAYYDDGVAFRTQMIEANSLIEFLLFKNSPVSKVIIGEEGWLFYNPDGSDGDPIEDLNGENMYSQEQLQILAAQLLSARDTLQTQGKEFIIYIAPNKESIYGQRFLPAKYVRNGNYTRGEQVVDYLLENTDLVIIHPLEAIQQAREIYPEYLFYYKTDTHWNNLGAYVGARELLTALDVHIPELTRISITESDCGSGDLANMMGLTKYLHHEKEYHLDGYLLNSQTPDVSTQENNRIHTFTTTNMNPKSVLIIRDSFSTAMMPYISAQFNSCCFIHRNIYTPEHLNQYNPDVVVLQIVERYTDFLFNFTVQSDTI